jgi:hypothetical protein
MRSNSPRPLKKFNYTTAICRSGTPQKRNKHLIAFCFYLSFLIYCFNEVKTIREINKNITKMFVSFLSSSAR